MKKVLLILFLFCFSRRLPAQHDSAAISSRKEISDSSSGFPIPLFPQDLLYFELGGNAGLISINYERNVFNTFSLRVGYGRLLFAEQKPTGAHYGTAPVFLAMVNYIYPSRSCFYEIGAGTGFLLGSAYRGRSGLFSDLSGSVFIARLAGVFVPSDGGLFFGIAYTPFIHFHPLAVISFFGLSLGYTF